MNLVGGGLIFNGGTLSSDLLNANNDNFINFINFKTKLFNALNICLASSLILLLAKGAIRQMLSPK